MGRAFVVVAVPAADTLIGRLTQDVPGCTVDMLGRPVVTGPEHRYELHLNVRGVTPDAKADLETRLPEVYSRFDTVSYDPHDGQWIVSAEVPVANIRSPGLRFIAGLFGLAPMPWLLFRDGVAHVRLLPGREEMIAQVVETLERRLRAAEIPERAHVESSDLHERFEARVQAAGWQER